VASRAKPRLGVAYYPEQWPRERWPVDAALMADAGLSLVRIGEFAWSRVEPARGRFDFGWLDDALDVFASVGLDVVLGTPTAAPPAWLIERHPEILPVHTDGRRAPFGNRRHYCPNAPAVREAAERVVSALGERYGRDARVVAWQIDNELGGRCYCDTCRERFQGWLEERYGSLDNLNESWGTAFWSQVYSSWGQIPLPPTDPVALPNGFAPYAPNPGLALDFRRFASESLIGFLRLQVDVLRRHTRDQPITHNLMGFAFGEVDYHALAAEVDFISWDNYPVLDATGRWSTPALAADTMRGLTGQPTWVLEQQVGALGWEMLLTPRRGEMRLHALQAIAHGAEAIFFFRWRTARFGTEQHWHGVLDADGRTGRRYRELCALADELSSLRHALADARPLAEAALLNDYDSRFALQAQPTNRMLAYEEHMQCHYEALRRLGLGVDVVAPAADLSRYALVVAPNLYVVDPAVSEALRRYVDEGGVLVLSPRAGVKDRANALPERPVPAWLDELAGLEVVDYASEREPVPVAIDGGSFAGWYEEVELKGARPLALYSSGEFAGSPAVAVNDVGHGRVVYIAGVADVETLRGFLRRVCDTGVELPDGVELVRLASESNGELSFLLNHADEERKVELDGRTHVLERLGTALIGAEEQIAALAGSDDADR
jgi:beta-galactosidase